MKYIWISILLTLAVTPIEAQKIQDTINTANGKVVMFSNHKWQYLSDLNFSGYLNTDLRSKIVSDTNLSYNWPWNNDICFPSHRTNNLRLLNDTLVLNLVDSAHPNFVDPYKGVLTSKYGFRGRRYHKGIDIAIPVGDTIVAAFDGKVRYAKYNNGGFGNLVIIRQYNGLETYYAHMSKLLVTPNEWVKAGQPIGLGGATGHAFGSNLHFEVRFYDKPINPEEVINFKDGTLISPQLKLYAALFRLGVPPSYTSDFATYSEKKFVRIKSGDTLSEIAARNNTSISRLCRLNGISRKSTLHIGHRLQVR